MAACLMAIGNRKNVVWAESAEATVEVPVACTMTSIIDDSGAINDGYGPHSAEIPSGTYRENIGRTVLTVTCNDSNGYDIYTVGYTGKNYGSNILTANIGGVYNSNFDIATGTATSGANSNWAMKLTASGDTDFVPTIENSFDNYHSVPNDYLKVASYNAANVNPGDSTVVSGSKLIATYAAYIAGTQPSGSYSGQVKYTLVHPESAVPVEPSTCSDNTICYFPNATSVADTMDNQPAATSVTLWASNFQRPGYGFAGWSTTYDYSDPNGFYGPNETITLTSDQVAAGLPLYAIWIKSTGTFQDFAGRCALLTKPTFIPGATEGSGYVDAGLDSLTALTDERDGNTYAVARLTDGNCWMIENLRLDNTATLTMENTNNPALPLVQSWYINSTTSIAQTSANHLSPSVPNANLSQWCAENNSDCDNQSMIRTDNTTNPVAMMDTGNANIYSYGNYYNWYSATAGRGTYSMTTGNTDGDICPYGWHLPIGGQTNVSGSFSYLDTTLGGTGATQSTSTASNRFRKYPHNYIYGGYTSSTTASNSGSVGYYWSATAGSSSSARFLYLNSSSVSPGTNISNKYLGWGVR